MSVKIFVSQGAMKFVGGTITETTGKDISSSTFVVGLGGSESPPTVWVTPTVDQQGATTAKRIVKLLVTNTTAPGTYWCWAKITDSPEIEPLIVQGAIIVV